MKKSYSADDISALSGGEHVRMRPHLYFEDCFSEGTIDALPFEVLCHAFDEHLDGNCSEVKLTISQDSFHVEYDAGMSLSMIMDDLSKAEAIMTKVMACSNQKKHLEVGDAFCSVGMATINFACSRSELETCSEGQNGRFLFKDGVVEERKIILSTEKNEWTKLFMEPNKAIFKELSFTTEGIEKRLKKIETSFPELSLSVQFD